MMYKHIGYVDGGKTEEWCLPFLTWSTYFVIKYFEDFYNNHKIELNKYISLFFGISFGVCFMMKQTSAIIMFVLVLFSYINLLINKQYKNLLLNITCCMLGFIIIVLPFLLYFYLNNTLNDYIFANFIFQIAYAKGYSKGFSVNLLEVVAYYYPVYINFFTVLVLIKQNKIMFSLALFYSLVLGYAVLLLSYHGTYYETIFFPLFPLFVNELKSFIFNKRCIEKYVLFIVPFALLFGNRFVKTTNTFKIFIPVKITIDTDLQDVALHCENDSIAGYSFGPANKLIELPLLYRNNKSPIYKYFFNTAVFSNYNFM